MWVVFAFGSALFAGLTAILAKCGVKNTDQYSCYNRILLHCIQRKAFHEIRNRLISYRGRNINLVDIE